MNNQTSLEFEPTIFVARLWRRVLEGLVDGSLRPCSLCPECEAEECPACLQCQAWVNVAIRQTSQNWPDSDLPSPSTPPLPSPSTPFPVLEVSSVSSWSSIDSLEIPGAPPPSFGWDSDSEDENEIVPSTSRSYSWEAPLSRTDNSSPTVLDRRDLEERIRDLEGHWALRSRRADSLETLAFSESDCESVRSHESDFW